MTVANSNAGTDITTGRRLPYEQTMISDVDIKGISEPDLEADSNFVDTNSDASSDSSVLELTERLGEIQDILDQLYKLSFKIRNTSYRSFNPKPLLFQNIDPQTGKDVFSAYAIYDRRHVEETFKCLRHPPTAKEPDEERARRPENEDTDFLDCGYHRLPTKDFLRDRLAKAITNRRRYFAYWERHALKLGRVIDVATSKESAQNAATSIDIIKQPLEQLTVDNARGSLNPTTAPKTIMSATEHSAYNLKLDDLLETETVISYATTAYDIDGKSAKLPPLPIGAAKGSEFICPYCWVLCPPRQGQGKAWQ